MKEENKSTICPLPWNHVMVPTNGDLRVCCQCIHKPFGIIKDQESRNYNAATCDTTEWRNSETLRQIRKEMLAGEKPEICKLCWSEESNGQFSKRMASASIYKDTLHKISELTNEDGTINPKDFPLENLDIRFGNLCNLKCRYCGPQDSSSWYSDHLELTKDEWINSGKNPTLNYFDDKEYAFTRENNRWTIKSTDFTWYNNSNFLNDLVADVSIPRRLYFTGGEPTIIPAHWDFLRNSVESGLASSMTLDYNSNTTSVHDWQFEIWRNFKKVNFSCSIDGMNEKCDYLRAPVRWEKIHQNILKLDNSPSNIEVYISVTVSVFNILHVLELADHFINNNYKKIDPIIKSHNLTYPQHYSSTILPQKAKVFVGKVYELFLAAKSSQVTPTQFKELSRTLKAHLEHMKTSDDSHLIQSFIDETKKIDVLRNQEFKKVFSDLHRLLSLEND